MQKATKKQYFTIGSITDQLDDSLIVINAINRLEEVLNQKVQLKPFGGGLKKIFFIPLFLKNENRIHPETVAFNPSHKELEIHRKIDCSPLDNSQDKCLSIIANKFYESIDLFPLDKINDFDLEGFKRKIKSVFDSESIFV